MKIFVKLILWQNKIHTSINYDYNPSNISMKVHNSSMLENVMLHVRISNLYWPLVPKTQQVTPFAFVFKVNIRLFHKLYENGNIGIFVFTASKPKKSSDKMLPPVRIEPRPLIASDSKSNTILSTLTWHLLVRLRV